MDKFHYEVIEKNEIIKIENILEIVYTKYVGNTLEEYNKILENENCRLVGE